MKHDFTPNELKPLSVILRAWNRNAYECYALREEEEVLGYAFFVREGSNCLFDYFAIEKHHRNRGLGSFFLNYLRSGYRKTDVTSKVFGADYRILEIPTGEEHTAKDLIKIYTDLYRSTLPEQIFRTQFEAGEG